MPGIPAGCAFTCVMAVDSICRCRCGGDNHGKGRTHAFPGYFCEDCGMSFGTITRDLEWRGCYVSTGRSTKYEGWFGGFGSAHYCRECYVKRNPAERTSYYYRKHREMTNYRDGVSA